MYHVCRDSIDSTFLFFLFAIGLGALFITADQATAAYKGTDLQNSTYSGFSVTDGPVTLKNGVWHGKLNDESGANSSEIKLLTGSFLISDFNRDGREEAAVLLSENRGESTLYYYLAVVEGKEGTFKNIATKLLGEQLQVVEFKGDNGAIVLKVVQLGPNDPPCCPSEMVTRTFTLKGNNLEEESRDEEEGQVSLDALAGVTWILSEWSYDEPAPAEPEITLVYQGDKFTGFSGCNSYSIDALAGKTPGTLILGMVNTSRMACSEQTDASEMRFHEQLASVTGYSFDNRRLLLNNDEGNTMIFTRRD